MLIDIGAVIIGLILLSWSADQLVHYASALAKHMGVTPFLVGVIIIGFGTSAPELFVSAIASLDHKGGLAIGNALGSNIANIGFVLGFAALMTTLQLSRKMVRQDLVVIFMSGVVALLLMQDKELSRYDGLILITLLIAFLLWSAVSNRLDDNDQEESTDVSTLTSTLWTLGTLALLIISSKILLHGAVGIATALGISELIIGLTIVAIGTSLPELAASIAAVRRNESGMVAGNIVGSNAFNTLGVIGVAGLINNTAVEPAVLHRDFPMMFIVTALLLVFVARAYKIKPWQGGALLVTYIVYLVYLLLQTFA